MSETKYPVFRNPDDYMRMRHQRTLGGWLKVFFEHRAIDRCLEDLEGVESVCDVPSGPGRLFPYWQQRGFRVLGFDYSEQMVEASRRELHERDLQGEVGHADAFALGEEKPEAADLVASVRFIYYFDATRRVELLKSLAKATRRYVLVQYKTTETLKGHMNRVRDERRGRQPRAEHLAKSGCSHAQILRELTAAGLVPIRVQPIGELSDRVYVLAEKLSARLAGGDAFPARRPQAISISNISLTNLPLVVFFALAAIYLGGYGARGIWEQTEAYYALGARSVLDGQWLLPRIYHGIPAASPPIAFWWYALGGALLGGLSDASIYLMSLLASLIVLALTYRVGRRWGGREVGLLGMVVLGTSYEFWEMAYLANSEMLTTAMLLALWGSAVTTGEHPARRCDRWLGWGSLALLPLTGGVWWLAAGIAGLALARLAAPSPSTASTRFRSIGAGLVLAAAPLTIWALATGLSEGWPAVKAALLHGAGGGPFADLLGDPRPWYYYVEQLPVNLLPWSFLLLLIAWRALRTGQWFPAPGWERPALVLFAAGLAVISLRPDKEDYHLMPLAPVAALLLASFIWRLVCDVPGADTAAEPARQGRPFWGRFLGLQHGRLMAVAALLLAGVITIYSVVGTRLREGEESPAELIDLIVRNVDEEDRLYLFEDKDLRLMYYMPEQLDYFRGTSEEWEALRQLLAEGKPVDVLIHEDDVRKLQERLTAPLRMEGSRVYRGERYFLLTNE